MYLVLPQDHKRSHASMRPGMPVGARIFGDLKDEESEVNKILDKERINVLKADLGTKQKSTTLDLTGK